MITVNNKQVNLQSFSMADVDTNDYPDFVDAYIESADFVDGIPLTDDELEILNEDGDLVHEAVFEMLY